MSIQEYFVPDLIVAGLARYVLGNVETGSALRSILEGGLYDAVARCDDVTLEALPRIVAVITTHVPSAAFGSTKRVAEWIANADDWTASHKSDRVRAAWGGFTDAR